MVSDLYFQCPKWKGKCHSSESQKILLENFQNLSSNSSAELIIRFKSDTNLFEKISVRFTTKWRFRSK